MHELIECLSYLDTAYKLFRYSILIPFHSLTDSRHSQLKRSHINFASYPYQRSQQSKGHMEIYLWTEVGS